MPELRALGYLAHEMRRLAAEHNTSHSEGTSHGEEACARFARTIAAWESQGAILGQAIALALREHFDTGADGKVDIRAEGVILHAPDPLEQLRALGFQVIEFDPKADM